MQIPPGRFIRRLLALRREFLKVGHIHATLDRLLQRCVYRSRSQSMPIEFAAGKPRMRFDLSNALLLVANAIGRYLSAQVTDQMLGGFRDARRHAHRIDAAQDRIVRAHVVFAAERRLADEQLVDENAERPVIDGPIVALVENDFGRNVFGCAGERPRFFGGLQDFRETKVDLFGG